MKRLSMILAVLAAAAGCSGNLEKQPVSGTVTVEISATASLANGSLKMDQFFFWSPGDRILVEISDGSYAVFQTEEGGETALFRGEIPAGTVPGQNAYYPADAVDVSGGGVSFNIGPRIAGGEGEALLPMAGTRWGGETFAFRAASGAVKLMVENIPADFGNEGSLLFSASKPAGGSYTFDPKLGEIVWDASGKAADIEISGKVSAGRSLTCYLPLPENDDWGNVRVSLKDGNGKTYREWKLPEGTLIPVETGRVTRLPALSFPSEIMKALNPFDGDFSFWDDIKDLTEDQVFTPWTWRSSWMAEDVYSTEDFNLVCKHIKFHSDEKFLYGYLYLDTTIPHNLNESLQHFYVMLDTDDISEGQSFGGNNIAEVPRYRGYNVMLYGTACTDGVPGLWNPALSNCTADAGAGNTNINGTVVNGVSDAGYGGGSFEGNILRWEFVIDRGKTGLTGRTHTNLCVAFCSGTNSPYLIMPSINGFELDLEN